MTTKSSAILSGVVAAKLTASRLKKAQEELTLTNPAYRSALMRGANTDEIPERLPYFTVADNTLILPRECSLARSLRLLEDVKDLRSPGKRVNFKADIQHTGQYVYQKPAVEALAREVTGTLVAGCGDGKTVMCLAAVAKVGVTTLFVVDNTELANQWLGAIEEYFGISKDNVALIRGPNCDYQGKPLGIALIQSLSKRKYSAEFYKYWGLVVTDEVHRLGAATWHSCIGKFPALRRWGLTATHERPDGMHHLIDAHLGGVIHEVERERLPCRILGMVSRLRLPSDQYLNVWNQRVNTAKLITLLAESQVRNEMILDTIQPALEKGRRVLILSSRNNQLKLFQKVMRKAGVKSGLLIGDTPDHLRENMRKNAQVLCVTAAYGKQALDVPDFDTMVLASPISANPPYLELKQAVGRIRRERKDKKSPVVIDIIDRYVPTMVKWWNKRRRWYESEKFPVHVRKN